MTKAIRQDPKRPTHFVSLRISEDVQKAAVKIQQARRDCISQPFSDDGTKYLYPNQHVSDSPAAQKLEFVSFLLQEHIRVPHCNSTRVHIGSGDEWSPLDVFATNSFFETCVPVCRCVMFCAIILDFAPTNAKLAGAGGKSR